MRLFKSNHEEMAYRAKLAAMAPNQLCQEYWSTQKARVAYLNNLRECEENEDESLDSFGRLIAHERLVEDIIWERKMSEFRAARQCCEVSDIKDEEDRICAMWGEAMNNTRPPADQLQLVYWSE